DQLREQRKRLLPAQIASFRRDRLRYSLLYDVQFRPEGDGLQRYGDRHHARQVRIVELVRVAYPFVGDQLEVFAAERMAVAGGEVRERHPVSAADFRVDLMDLAREAVGRKPFGHGSGVEKRAVGALGRCAQDTVESDSVGHDDLAFDTYAGYYN